MTIGQQRLEQERKHGIIKSDKVTDKHTNRWGEGVGQFKGQPVKWTWSTETWYYNV